MSEFDTKESEVVKEKKRIIIEESVKSKMLQKVSQPPIELELDHKESGWEEYLEKATILCSTQNEELLDPDAKARTGSSFISAMKEQAILDFFQSSKDEKHQDIGRGKKNWKYSFRLKSVGEKVILQKHSYDHNKRCARKAKLEGVVMNVTQKCKIASDSDWVELIACDTIEFFRILNNLHWKSNHTKGHELFKLGLPLLSSNHTTQLCRLIHEVCPVCKASNKGRKKKNHIIKPQESSSVTGLTTGFKSNEKERKPKKVITRYQTIPKKSDKVIQYGVAHISELLESDSRFSHILVVWYVFKSPFIDLIPLQSQTIEEVGGSLVSSFLRNDFPTHLHYVELQKQNIVSVDILNYVNIWMLNLSPKKTIQHCQTSLISQVLFQTVLIFRAVFTIPRVHLHIHSNIVLSYLRYAINCDGLMEQSSPNHYFMGKYLSNLQKNDLQDLAKLLQDEEEVNTDVTSVQKGFSSDETSDTNVKIPDTSNIIKEAKVDDENLGYNETTNITNEEKATSIIKCTSSDTHY